MDRDQDLKLKSEPTHTWSPGLNGKLIKNESQLTQNVSLLKRRSVAYIIAISTVVLSTFYLFSTPYIDIGSSENEIATVREARPSTHLPNELPNESLFFVNQMNRHTARGSIYITEDHIYVANFDSELIVFDHDLYEQSIIRMRSDWRRVESLHVLDEAIYHTTWDGDFYRHDLVTGRNELLTDEIFHEVVIENYVFHLNESWGTSNIYVYDLTTSEKSVLMEDEVRNFYINTADNTIIYILDNTLYQVDFDGNNLHRLSGDAWGVVFDGEMLAWSTWDAIHTLNLNTGLQEWFDFNDIDVSTISITPDYFIVLDWDDSLHLISRKDTNESRQITENVRNFAVVGNYIIYEDWDSFDVYAVDFDGNSWVLIEDDRFND